MPKKNTEYKVREAGNELVKKWRRHFKISVNTKKPPPRPISIPQIANVAGVAPKTIYTTPIYRAIAEQAVAKTCIEIDGSIGIPFLDKSSYCRQEVIDLLRLMKRESDERHANLVNSLAAREITLERLKKENDEQIRVIRRQIEEIVTLQSIRRQSPD